MAKSNERNVIAMPGGNVYDAADLQRQRIEWRRKSWTIPDLRGGKQAWFSVVKDIIDLVGSGQATNLDTYPDAHGIPDLQTWRLHTSFLRWAGLIDNQSGTLYLSDSGAVFYKSPTKRRLADIIHNKVRLFGEVLMNLESMPSTVEAVDEQLCRIYGLNWVNLSKTRKRMDWLEVLDLIEGVGDRRWGATTEGILALTEWSLISPDALESKDYDSEDVEIAEPPAEIAILLQRLSESPDAHLKRKTYNIWVPSPNRIDNLRRIIQAASERITKADLFKFIGEEFNLKLGSIESMLPFLKASGLLEEVGRSIYLATPAANAWFETGNDLDFIRILHANMQFVGEMIDASKNTIVRNDLYSQAKSYGLNTEKARWIAGFLLEAGLLEEPQYLHLKATPTGSYLASSLPLANKPAERSTNDSTFSKEDNSTSPLISEIDHILDGLIRSSCDPVADNKPSGVAFEEAIAHTFRFMGFDSKRIGGSGDTDVIVRWRDSSGTIITAIVDGKSKSSGQVSHSDISDVAIDTHKEINSADFVGIVGPGFSGDTIKNHARKKSFALITVDQLCGIAHASESIGLSPSEIGLAFKVPDGLSQLDELITAKQRELGIASAIIIRLNQEQETLGGLSPRDLFFMLRDTSVSPSLEEILNVVEILSKPEIGVIYATATGETTDPQHTTYVLGDAKRTVNRLRALATTINEALQI